MTGRCIAQCFSTLDNDLNSARSTTVGSCIRSLSGIRSRRAALRLGPTEYRLRAACFLNFRGAGAHPTQKSPTILTDRALAHCRSCSSRPGTERVFNSGSPAGRKQVQRECQSLWPSTRNTLAGYHAVEHCGDRLCNNAPDASRGGGIASPVQRRRIRAQSLSAPLPFNFHFLPRFSSSSSHAVSAPFTFDMLTLKTFVLLAAAFGVVTAKKQCESLPRQARSIAADIRSQVRPPRRSLSPPRRPLSLNRPRRPLRLPSPPRCPRRRPGVVAAATRAASTA